MKTQHRLQQSRVLVVGVGGLGAPVALLLAGSGLGTIGLADADVIELSNLNRQILFRQADIGGSKVDVAAATLARQFPALRIERYRLRVDATNALRLFSEFDFVVDATDGVASKYLLNDAAVLARTPLSHAGIVGLSGQTLTVLPGRSACLRCLFPDQPRDGDVPTCQEAGILGPVAGTIAALQAMEAIRYVGGESPAFADCLLTWDAARWRWHRIEVKQSASCPSCGVAPLVRLASDRSERSV